MTVSAAIQPGHVGAFGHLGVAVQGGVPRLGAPEPGVAGQASAELGRAVWGQQKAAAQPPGGESFGAAWQKLLASQGTAVAKMGGTGELDLDETGLAVKAGDAAIQGKLEEGVTSASTSLGMLVKESFTARQATRAAGSAGDGGRSVAPRLGSAQPQHIVGTATAEGMRVARTEPRASNVAALPRAAATAAKAAAAGSSKEAIGETRHAGTANDAGSPAQAPERAAPPAMPVGAPGFAVAPVSSAPNAAPFEAGPSRVSEGESDEATVADANISMRAAQVEAGATSRVSVWSAASGKGLASSKGALGSLSSRQSGTALPGVESDRAEDRTSRAENKLTGSRQMEVRPVQMAPANPAPTEPTHGRMAESEPAADEFAAAQQKNTGKESVGRLSGGAKAPPAAEPPRMTATAHFPGRMQAEPGGLSATDRPAIAPATSALERPETTVDAANSQAGSSPRVSLHGVKSDTASKENDAGMGSRAGHAGASGAAMGHGSGPMRDQPGTQGQDVANSGLARDLAGMRGNPGASSGATEAPREASGAPGARDAFSALDAESSDPAPSWIHAGAHRAEAGFQDPALGWVGVRADANGGSIHASLVPASADAAAALGGQMAGLSEHLAERHTPVETLTLAAPEGQGREAGAAQSGNQGMQQGAGQGTGEGSGYGAQAGSGADTAAGGAVQASEMGLTSSVTDVGYAAPPLGGTHISVMA